LAKKRAPGGGRKPQGDFSGLTKPLSIRLPDDLRAELEAAAGKSGKSVTQELLRRLNDSFHRDVAKQRDPASYALCFVLAELISLVNWNTGGDDATPSDWRKNPFAFKTIRLAFDRLMATFEPRGKVKAPSPLRLGGSVGYVGGSTPKEMAENAAITMLFALRNRDDDEPAAGPVATPSRTRPDYRLDRASRDLLLKGAKR
jgi:hypothetical protein